MNVSMPRWIGLGLLAAAGLGSSLCAAHADDEDNNRLSATVAFGRGLNTAQQGNVVNHAILPNDIKIKQDGVVQFLVAGFHEPVVFVPAVSFDAINKIANSGTSTFIFDPKSTPPDGTFYFGINPAGGPPPGTPPTPHSCRY